jgi:molybdate transport system substrate-binding protein
MSRLASINFHIDRVTACGPAYSLRLAMLKSSRTDTGTSARFRFFLVWLPWLMLMTGAACRRAAPARTDETAAPAGDPRLVVFAAASLRESFTALAPALARIHPGAEVTFNFAGSQELRTQIEHGAPADVFASADTRHMAALRQTGRVGPAVIFARNEPVMVVTPAQAATVHDLADLASVGRLVIGTPEVPIGRYTLQILERADRALGPGLRARIEARVVSRELNVRQVLAKVSLGEADAGIVYRTDALTAPGRVVTVPIAPALNVVAAYPIAVVAGAPHATLAQAFVGLVLSPDGQGLLARSGFLPAAAPAPGAAAAPRGNTPVPKAAPAPSGNAP